MRAARLTAGILALVTLSADRPAPRWMNDLDKALAAARASDKPVFAIFRCEH